MITHSLETAQSNNRIITVRVGVLVYSLEWTLNDSENTREVKYNGMGCICCCLFNTWSRYICVKEEKVKSCKR